MTAQFFGASCLAAILSLFCGAVAVEAAGVASGNSSGESFEAGATPQGTGQPVPPTPTLSSLIRLDKTKVQLTIAAWEGSSGSGDFLHVLQAIDDGPWQDVSPSGPVGGSPFPQVVEYDAPSDHDYRFVAIVVGLRPTPLGLPRELASNPSNELRLSDIAADLWLMGPSGNFDMPVVPYGGSFLLAGFIPESFVATNNTPAPNPFSRPGPYTQVYDLDPYDLWSPLAEATQGFRVSGYLERGASLLEYTINTGAGFLINANHPLTLPSSQSNQTASTSSGFVKVPKLDFEGESEKGFDQFSNPKWQMLPANPSSETERRQITALLPPFGNETWTSHRFYIENTAKVIAEQVGQTQNFKLTPQGSGEDRLSKHHALLGYHRFDKGTAHTQVRGVLGVDIRPKINLSLGIYPVYRRERSMVNPDHPGHRVPSSIVKFIPPKEAIEAELNAVYGSGANIFFSVTIEPGCEFEDWDEIVDDEYVVMGDRSGSSFEELANNDAHRVSLFIFDNDAWKREINGEFRPRQFAAEANAIPGNYVFADWKAILVGGAGLIAHEVGHCLGLYHAFQIFNNPASTTKIPDTADDRVMGYGTPNGKRLLKLERDRIHQNIPEPIFNP